MGLLGAKSIVNKLGWAVGRLCGRTSCGGD